MKFECSYPLIFFLFFRGVGCIFTEMLVGVATFPGMKDAYDQLDQIFRVNLTYYILNILPSGLI